MIKVVFGLILGNTILPRVGQDLFLESGRAEICTDGRMSVLNIVRLYEVLHRPRPTNHDDAAPRGRSISFSCCCCCSARIVAYTTIYYCPTTLLLLSPPASPTGKNYSDKSFIIVVFCGEAAREVR